MSVLQLIDIALWIAWSLAKVAGFLAVAFLNVCLGWLVWRVAGYVKLQYDIAQTEWNAERLAKATAAAK